MGFPNWVLGSAHGLLASAWALGRRELKSSGGVLYSVQTTLPEAGGQSPGRVPGATPWGPLAVAIAVAWADLHVNLWGCTTPRTLFAARGVQWPSGFPGKNQKVEQHGGINPPPSDGEAGLTPHTLKLAPTSDNWDIRGPPY